MHPIRFRLPLLSLREYVQTSDISYYYIDKSVLVENRPLVNFIGNYIRDSSGVFSIPLTSEDIDDVISSFTLLFVQKYSRLYNKKKITWRLEDMNMNFVFQVPTDVAPQFL